jgi:hypothetical protein
MLKLTLKDRVRHALNPLALYCRVWNITKRLHVHVGKKSIRRLCLLYEEQFYKPVFHVDRQENRTR